MDKIGHEDIKILNNRKFTKTLFSTKFNNWLYGTWLRIFKIWEMLFFSYYFYRYNLIFSNFAVLFFSMSLVLSCPKFHKILFNWRSIILMSKLESVECGVNYRPVLVICSSNLELNIPFPWKFKKTF
jgi:hypothetical protein